MNQEINITIPAISPELIANIETDTLAALETETAAITALRQKYAALARLNGYIKTADYSRATSNYSVDREAHYERDGKRVRALLAIDAFYKEYDDQNRGPRCGTRLYLTEHGEWLELTRVGHWTQWQGEAQYWYTDEHSLAAIEMDREGDEYGDAAGAITVLSDQRVAEDYDLRQVVDGVSKALGDMATKLPTRLTRIRQRAALAAKLLEALE